MSLKTFQTIAFFLAALFMSFPAFARPGDIQTVAGSFDGAGYGGDGGPATAVQLSYPRGVFVRDGRLYIAESGFYRIRIVNLQTGVIDTIAGGGSLSGDAADGGPAAARLETPYRIFVDEESNIYIAEASAHRVRRVDGKTSILTTVAGDGAAAFRGDGGPARQASLNTPRGVAVASNGDLFIADTFNHRIRKASALTGLIETVAGTGTGGFGGDGGPAAAAQLNEPQDIQVDASGDLYIADTKNRRIRKVNAASGIIETIAGTGLSGSAGDGGPALAAQFSFPAGLALDAAGNIYAADAFAHRIRKINAADGTISTFAGGNGGGTGGNGGPAVDAQLYMPYHAFADMAGNLYIADTAARRVRMVETEKAAAELLTLAEWAAGALTLALSVLGWFAIGRRRRPIAARQIL